MPLPLPRPNSRHMVGFATLIGLAAAIVAGLRVDTGIGMASFFAGLVIGMLAWPALIGTATVPPLWRYALAGAVAGLLSPVPIALVFAGPAGIGFALVAIWEFGFYTTLLSTPAAVAFALLAGRLQRPSGS